jgi:hypothetical protein
MAKLQRSIGSFSVRKHANLTAKLTVQGQPVSSVFIQVYIRVCTHCFTVSLILNIKYTLELHIFISNHIYTLVKCVNVVGNKYL